jgi:hypothetical protein
MWPQIATWKFVVEFPVKTLCYFYQCHQKFTPQCQLVYQIYCCHLVRPSSAGVLPWPFLHIHMTLIYNLGEFLGYYLLQQEDKSLINAVNLTEQRYVNQFFLSL